MNELFIKIDGEFYPIRSYSIEQGLYNYKRGYITFLDNFSGFENTISIQLANKLGIYKSELVKTEL